PEVSCDRVLHPPRHSAADLTGITILLAILGHRDLAAPRRGERLANDPSSVIHQSSQISQVMSPPSFGRGHSPGAADRAARRRRGCASPCRAPPAATRCRGRPPPPPRRSTASPCRRR